MLTNRRKNLKQRFGYIPRYVLLSKEFQTLTYAHRHLLLCIAAQYNGHNNGHLTFTRQDGLRFGFRSEDTRCKALKRLQELGLIIKTHKGGIDVLGAPGGFPGVVPGVVIHGSGTGVVTATRHQQEGGPEKDDQRPEVLQLRDDFHVTDLLKGVMVGCRRGPCSALAPTVTPPSGKGVTVQKGPYQPAASWSPLMTPPGRARFTGDARSG